ncbi:hypothetical protein P3T76_003816 [Phytophthora citrophthora]|uniref:Uncharacterized protein n=1 Tax=Phytophthora citrophthora TaxID=4793 RepID=A0AAD9GW40_9STRA|nr:hypothetical protein P3T76_003816 [Phytophthora citrophthora]
MATEQSIDGVPSLDGMIASPQRDCGAGPNPVTTLQLLRQGVTTLSQHYGSRRHTMPAGLH